MKLFAAVCTFFVIFGSSIFPAQAACANGQCWGAVGIGPPNYRAHAHHYPSAAAAKAAAQGFCSGRCRIIRTFVNSCATIYVGDGGGWGWAFAPSRAQAIKLGAQYCARYASNCRLWVQSCSLPTSTGGDAPVAPPAPTPAPAPTPTPSPSNTPSPSTAPGP